ncbi:DinB family protein [Chthonobacter rhizosphaerae]|uniref:DinB family protein n=1 Tax=Chthonobacter rhizosphaerae TaxID=2735553 RepID=UPI001AEDF682|nr:DinB family protein [Chthonobacter rhizosphaerae]
MSAVDLVRGLARNNAFSNRRLLAACARLTPEAFAAARTSFFPSILETANHILEVDLYYLDALREGGRGQAVFEAYRPFADPAALAAAQADTDAALVGFCDGLDDAGLSREVATDRGEDGRVMERVDALLLHLFQHQIHHRGQIHAMLAGTDVPPPQLDEFFLRFDAGRRVGRGEGVGSRQ